MFGCYGANIGTVVCTKLAGATGFLGVRILKNLNLFDAINFLIFVHIILLYRYLNEVCITLGV